MGKVNSMILISFQDYTDSDVQVVSRGRIDNLTSYVTDDNINNHEFKVLFMRMSRFFLEARSSIVPENIAFSTND